MIQIQQPILQHHSNWLLKSGGEASKIINALQTTTEIYQEAFGANQSLLLLFDTQKREKVYYINQLSENFSSFLTLCCQLIEKNQSLLLQRKLISWKQGEENGSFSLKNLAQEAQIQSVLIIPLYYQQTYLGELCVFHQQNEYQWTEKEYTLVRHFSNQCSTTIHCIQQFQHQAWQKQLIKQITEKLNSYQEPELILKDILKLVGQSFRVDQVLILSLEDTELQVEQEWILRQTSYSLVEKKLALDEWNALLDTSYDLNKYSYNWQDLPITQSKFLNLETRAVQPGSLISVPIYIREKFFGVLVLQSIQIIQYFSPEDLETLSEIAQQIAIAIHHLQNQNQWLTQQLEKLELQKQHLELAKKKTSEFLDYTIHELRSPLTGILSFSQTLHDQIYGSLNPKQSQYIAIIVSSGQHMLSLINDFLDLSKISAQREELILEAIAVEDVCLASIAMIQIRAQEAQLALTLNISSDVDFCTADQRRIKQILVNLLTNAIKFTEVGSVTLKVERKSDYLEFSVIDTGIGITEEDQEKLFQPFQQIKNHLSRKHKGTGLGLALSRQLAQLHGGDITVVSRKGEGSCFTLRLPI